MVKINQKKLQAGINTVLLLLSSLVVNSVFAIDNPDAPDLIGEFKKREQIFLKAIDNPQNGSRDYLIAYDKYQTFLDSELNVAYRLIKSKLSVKRQKELKNSQRNWIKFRDAEFELINNNWTRQNFGSSAGMSRGSYRSTVIKNRVLQLLYYAINY